MLAQKMTLQHIQLQVAQRIQVGIDVLVRHFLALVPNTAYATLFEVLGRKLLNKIIDMFF